MYWKLLVLEKGATFFQKLGDLVPFYKISDEFRSKWWTVYIKDKNENS